MSNIELNKYYLRKRFEKQKMMVSSLTQIIKKKEDDKARGLIEERGGMADQEINESIAQSEDGQDPQVQMQFGNTASMYSDYGRGSINIWTRKSMLKLVSTLPRYNFKSDANKIPEISRNPI